MKSIGGWLLIALSCFMLLGFFNSTTPHPIGVTIFTFLIAIILPMVGGILMLYSVRENNKNISQGKSSLAQKTLDAEILKFAQQNDGQLTVVEVAAQFALGTSEAEEVLDQLAQRGLADYQVTDSGLMVYSFTDVRHLHEKSQAKRVLDA